MEEFIIINFPKKLEIFGIDQSQDEDPTLIQESYIGAYLYTISEFLENEKITVNSDLIQLLTQCNKNIIKKLIQEKIIPKNGLSISLEAITDVVYHLCHTYISKNTLGDPSINQKKLVSVIKNLIITTHLAKEKIAEILLRSIQDHMNILIYGYSIHVIYSLIYARKKGKTFTVYVANSNEKDNSKKIFEILKKNDVDCKLILGVSIGFYLSKIDIVLSGADAVCENGGIVNKMGTFTTAICAKNFKKQFYVLVDSLKYLKIYVLGQNDLSSNLENLNIDEGIDDFTPSEFISLFFTDKGIFTPSALCDEIIQLFYS